RVVRAFSGAMGGSDSEEFLAPAAVGEDTFVACGRCGYAANTEVVEVGRPPDPGAADPAEPSGVTAPGRSVGPTGGAPTGRSVGPMDVTATGRSAEPLEVLETPDTPTIESLCALLGVPAAATLKNLLVRVDGRIVAVGVPGDRELDLTRLSVAVAP